VEYIDLFDIPSGELRDYIVSSFNYSRFIDWSSRERLAIDMINRDKYHKAVLVSFDHSVDGLYVISVLPRFSLGPGKDFTRENLLRLLKMGYLDGLSAYGMVAGDQYYIHGSNTIREMFCNLDMEEKLQAVELLEIDVQPGSALDSSGYFFDRIIRPELKKTADTETRLIEKFAGDNGIAKLELYSQRELIGKAVEQYLKRPAAEVFYDKCYDFLSYLYLKTPGLSGVNGPLDDKYIKGYENLK
jgi:hypothetical protein